VEKRDRVNSAPDLLHRYASGERIFEEARLSGADLHRAILHGIDLSEGILSEANLSRADLRGADLSWADLSGADLRGTDLRGAILTRADLSGANLTRANLYKADLSLATLTDARLSETVMPDGTLKAAAPKETLQLYHTPLSVNSRRVWVALLEKDIPFELISLSLDGDQFEPEFLEISPFNRIPVLVDGDFNIIESIAILDYLEAKYPLPSLLPLEPKAIARVRMAEMVTINELLPATMPFLEGVVGLDVDEKRLQKARKRIETVLTQFQTWLGDRPFLGGDRLSLADIVAGTTLPALPMLGIPLDNYPKLNDWMERLIQRPSWQQTQPDPQIFEAAKKGIRDRLSKMR